MLRQRRRFLAGKPRRNQHPRQAIHRLQRGRRRHAERLRGVLRPHLDSLSALPAENLDRRRQRLGFISRQHRGIDNALDTDLRDLRLHRSSAERCRQDGTHRTSRSADPTHPATHPTQRIGEAFDLPDSAAQVGHFYFVRQIDISAAEATEIDAGRVSVYLHRDRLSVQLLDTLGRSEDLGIVGVYSNISRLGIQTIDALSRIRDL